MFSSTLSLEDNFFVFDLEGWILQLLRRSINKFSLGEYTTSNLVADTDEDRNHLGDINFVINATSRYFTGNQLQHNESSVTMGDSIVYDNSEKPYSIDEIIWDNQRFKLNIKMLFRVMRKNDYYIIDFEPLGIQIIEKSIDEALESLNEEFSMLWKIYGQEDDDKLSKDAIALKRNILKYVGEVERI